MSCFWSWAPKMAVIAPPVYGWTGHHSHLPPLLLGWASASFPKPRRPAVPSFFLLCVPLHTGRGVLQTFWILETQI